MQAALLILLLLLVPNAFASTISNVALSSGGAPIVSVGTSREQLVDLSFTADNTTGYLFLDLSQLHSAAPAQYKNWRIDLSSPSSCIMNATTKTSRCTIPNLAIKPVSGSIPIVYRFFVGGSTTPDATYLLQLTIDSTAPSVTSIRTTACNAANTACYVGSGLATNVTVELADPDGAFAKHLVFYQLGPTQFAVGNCTGNTCVGKATVACVDEASLDLKVIAANGIPSQDDAGNPVSNPGMVQRVVCDAQPPTVVAIEAKGTGLLDLITQDGQLVVKATVRDAVTLVTMSARTSNVQLNVSANTTMSAACTRTINDDQECTLSIPNLKYGRNLNLPLTFTDQVGHTTSRTLVVKSILKVANASMTPNFFEARAYQVMPASINRVALQLALDNALDYPLFINYRVTQLVPGAQILEQKVPVSTCEMVAKPRQAYADPYAPHPAENWTAAPALFMAVNDGNLRVFFPNQDAGENRIDASFLKLDTSKDLGSDTVLVRCNLSLVIEKDNTIYTVPEQEPLYWSIRLTNSKLGAPGAAFITKLREAEGDVNGGTNQLIGYANTVTSTLGQLCQMQGILNTIAQGGLSIEAIGQVLMMSGLGQGIANTGSPIANRAILMSASYWGGTAAANPAGAVASGVQGAVANGANDLAAKGAQEAQGTARKMCDYIHCDTAKRMEDAKPGGLLRSDDGFANMFSGTGVARDEAYGQYVQGLNTPSVKDSLLASLTTQCWGGVVYNLNKYRQIDCGYVECLKEQALSGASVTPCELAKGVKMCRFVMGEVFELPYVRVVKNLAGNVNQIVQNPLSLVINKLQSPVCKGTERETKATARGFACRVMKTIALTKDFSAMTKNNMLFSYPYQADLCQKALCEGKECDRTTGSLIEQLLPNQGYSGDQYRQTKLKEIEARQNGQENAAMLKSVKTWTAGSELTPEMEDYAKRENIPEKDRNAFFTKAVINCADGKQTPAACTSDFTDKVNRGVKPSDPAFNKYVPENERTAYSYFSEADALTHEKNSKYYWDAAGNLKIKGCEAGETTDECNRLRDRQAAIGGIKNKDAPVDPMAGFSRCSRATEGGKTETVLCAQNCNDVSTCLTAAQAANANGNGPEAAKIASTQKFYGWVDQMVGIAYEYLRESGQLDSFFLSGWGEWGAKVSATSEQYLTVEGWQNNLCNPAGEFSDYTQDDGSVYAWQENTYRAVLTFAGERLPYETRAADQEAPKQNLYTVSVVAVSPNYDEEMTVTLEPGAKEAIGKTQLSRGAVVSKSIALNDTAVFTRVCVTFAKPFPKGGGDTSFCRPLQASAYDRGSVTNETMPEWGVQDPYGGVSWSSGAGGATGTTGMTGGLQ